MNLELRGDIPGLLRFTSPVVVLKWSRGRVVLCVSPLVVAARKGVTDIVDEVDGCDVALDLTDPTGRLHARLWLAERGHNVGSEDRAEVLAWSVLSVHQGGKPLAGVAQSWSFVARKAWWRRKTTRPGFWTASVTRHGWMGMGGMGTKTGEDGKAAADADLLRLGWALTNADGTLTLPPLPGAA